MALLLHAALMAGAAVLLACLLPCAAARAAGRTGPPLWQPLHDARRLLRKRPVVTEAAGPLLLAAPSLCLAVTAVAALLTPSFTLGMATSSLSDLVVIAALLALCRVAAALAALDSGAAPPGLAASHSLRLAALACPALLLAVFSIASITGTTNLDAALAGPREVAALPFLLAGCGVAAIAVALAGEDEALIAELSGWRVVAAQAATALRRVVWLTLTADLLLPAGLASAGAGPVAWLAGIAAWALKITVLAAAGAAAAGSLRLASAAPRLLGAALLLSLLAVLFLFAGQTLA